MKGSPESLGLTLSGTWMFATPSCKCWDVSLDMWTFQLFHFIPVVAEMSKCPWARHWTPNWSWMSSLHLEWQRACMCVCVCDSRIVKHFGKKQQINAADKGVPNIFCICVDIYILSHQGLRVTSTCVSVFEELSHLKSITDMIWCCLHPPVKYI